MSLLHLDDRTDPRALDYDSLDAAPDTNAAYYLGATEARCMWEPGNLDGYDTVLVSMTKYQHRDREDGWMSAIPRLKAMGKRVWVFQESEYDWLTRRPDNEQFDFIRNCRQADAFYCHTAESALFFKALLRIPTQHFPTLLRLDKIPTTPREWNPRKIVVLGTPDDCARGQIALTAVRDAMKGESWDIHLVNRDGAPSSENRMKALADVLGVPVTVYPYLAWKDYAAVVSGAQCFISGCERAAAGRDEILAHWLGVRPVTCFSTNAHHYEDFAHDVWEAMRNAQTPAIRTGRHEWASRHRLLPR